MTESSSAPTATSRAPGRSGLVIGILVLSAFVTLLNETILSVALRELTIDLHIPTTTAQWLTSGFLLTMAVVIPTTGFLLERLTSRQVFLMPASRLHGGRRCRRVRRDLFAVRAQAAGRTEVGRLDPETDS
jgi:DHA2 family lincomycin resistance protein-like MFS transporter